MEKTLIQASINGHLDIVECLIESGADIHAENDYALRYASINGHVKTVKFLIQSGADIHADNDGALKWASINGHLDIVKYLVQSGADIRVVRTDIQIQAWNLSRLIQTLIIRRNMLVLIEK